MVTSMTAPDISATFPWHFLRNIPMESLLHRERLFEVHQHSGWAAFTPSGLQEGLGMHSSGHLAQGDGGVS